MRTYHSDLSWNFIVSSPTCQSGDFRNSVIFLIEDTPEKSLGVIINRPLDKEISDFTELNFDSEVGQVEVFDGGPVGINELKLASFVLNDTEVGSFQYGLPPNRLESIIKSPYVVKPMAFLGYVCWDYKQFRDEINNGYWFLSNVDMNIIFETNPEDLWRELLIREFPAIADINQNNNLKSN